jgi:MOSC domain-containing protein YiiM
MPREGIFVRVHQGGQVKVGDTVEVLTCPPPAVQPNNVPDVQTR